MRLTLRTLLAYLDDVLDPADKEELAHKIESSDFAEDLVHRTRDTVRRLRLSAPQLIGTGMGLDPNSVAEYLDNVMPPDQVGDFERICLESDVHLAEAAACHHVLTMILGQPAEVDPIARQRMYTIATEASERKQIRIEPAHTVPPTTVAVAAPGQTVRVAELPQPSHRAVEVPEYLRTGGWWRSWVVLAPLAALLLVAVVVLIAGGNKWFGHSTTVVLAPSGGSSSASPGETSDAPAMNATNVKQTEAVGENDAKAGAATALAPRSETSAPGTQPAATPPAASSAATADKDDRYNLPAAANKITSAAPESTVIPPTTPPTDTLQTPVAPAAGTTGPGGPAATPPPKPLTADGTTPMPPAATTTPVVPSTPGAPTANVPLPTPPQNPSPTANIPPATGTTAAPVPPPANPNNGAGDKPVPAAVATNETPTLPATLDSTPGGSSKSKVPAGPPEIGTYMGGKTVLLRYDGKTNAWFRVEPRAAITAGERLVALPEFRPSFALVSGLRLDMSGGTQILLPPSAAKEEASAAVALPTIEVVYGRLVLINPTGAESHVQLKMDSTSGEATLGRNATLAVEVERKHVPGQDPRQTPAPIECRLYAPYGTVTWKDVAGTKRIEKPSKWTASATGATEPIAVTSMPDWIDGEPIVQASDQRIGAPKLDSSLVANVPVETQLLELFQGSKDRPVKSLVARSSVHVGQFVPFIEALRDSDQRSNWKNHIDALRAAMALSPESANRVWEQLVEQRGRPAATDLWEMLCGYTSEQIGHKPEEIKNGAIAKLIDRLESDSLDYRVLAVQDLAEITGKRLMTNPAAGLAERTQSIRKWRARLEAGDLKPVATPQ